MKGHDIVGGHGSKIWHEYFRKETIHLRRVQQNPTWTQTALDIAMHRINHCSVDIEVLGKPIVLSTE